MRRVHLKGRENILKRLLIHAAGFNLGLVMRKTLGVGKPRRLQGLPERFFELWAKIWRPRRHSGTLQASIAGRTPAPVSFFGAITSRIGICSTPALV